MLARCYIRNADDFYNVVQLLFRIAVVLLPFAFFEFVSGRNISRELFGLILPTYTDAMPARFGFARAQSVFDHPILFGVFTGSILALVYLVLGFQRDFASRFFMSAIVAATSMLSVSSSPLTALVVQALLLCWNGLLSTVRFRWKLLIALAVSISVTIELVANRSLLDIFVSYVLFDSGSYWFRKLIWLYGTESVQSHPWFGTGMYEWERPSWMGPSIDNFWLFHAVRYGLPAAFLMSLAFFSIFLAVSLKKGLDSRQAAYRTGFLITMTAFFLVAWTTHFWDSAYVVFLFLMGSGVWMLDVKPNQKSAWDAPRV
jgi:O-antigen ligase